MKPEYTKEFTMKTKTIFASTIAIFAIATTQVSALDNSDHLELLENAVIEQASTPAQKTAVSEYLANVAREKQELAQSFRAKAGLAYGGKAMTQIQQKKEFLRMAEQLEVEAQKYKRVSLYVNPSEVFAAK